MYIFQNIIVSDTKERALHIFDAAGQLIKSVSTGNLIPGLWLLHAEQMVFLKKIMNDNLGLL